MATDKNVFLFAWNAVKYEWPELQESAELLKRGEKISESWTCTSHKKVRIGDRAFFSKVGSEPRGIFASGYVASEVFFGKNHRGKENHRVMINFDVLLDPDTTPILTLDIITIGRLSKQMWTPQSSGISIKPEFVDELEALWQDFLSQPNQHS